MNVHDFSAKDITGRERKLAEFAGKLLLIVNTASKCGFTPQYEGLETLQKRFQDDLVIIGFPCNQFGGQEPGSEAEIASFCDLNFKVSFPMFAKIDVKGNEAHPLYKYLTHEVRHSRHRSDQMEFHQIPCWARRHANRSLCADHQTGRNC